MKIYITVAKYSLFARTKALAHPKEEYFSLTGLQDIKIHDEVSIQKISIT